MSAQPTNDRVEIRDPGGSAATIHTGFGFNCTRFVAATEGDPVEVIWSEPDFSTASASMLSGMPVLFPFGGRLVGTAFRWRGREYTITDGIIENGTAIHGLVLNRPWRVLERAENRVVGEFQASVDEPALLSQWPSDFRIRVAYQIAPASLTCDITIDNPDEKPLPYGFATHSFFRTPLAGGQGEVCEVTIPAAAIWVLDEHFVPTGEIRPVDAEKDLRDGPAIAGRRLNTVYTDLATDEEGDVVCSVHDPAAGQTVRITSSGGFREMVVWNPPHREAIAIEPYTCCPTTFDLEERGHSAGLRVLDLGESDRLRIVIELVKD